MMMMTMYFHFRIGDPILLKEWVPGNVAGYVFSCIAVGALAAFFEFLKYGRYSLGKQVEERCRCENETVCPCGELTHSDADSVLIENTRHIPWAAFIDGRHVLNTLTMFFQTFLGLSLMMVAMTYNVPLVASVIAGHSIAYFLIGPLLTIEEHEKMGADCCG